MGRMPSSVNGITIDPYAQVKKPMSHLDSVPVSRPLLNTSVSITSDAVTIFCRTEIYFP